MDESMKKYISKSAIVAEIRHLQLCTMDEHMNYYSSKAKAEYDILNELLLHLDTLEVKEEILDESGKTNLMRKCVHKAFKSGYDMGVLQTTNKMNHNTKDVDLEKEIDKWWCSQFTDYSMKRVPNHKFIPAPAYIDSNFKQSETGKTKIAFELGMDWKVDSNDIEWDSETIRKFAKHFFELGLNAQQKSKDVLEHSDVDMNSIFEEIGVDPDSHIASLFKNAFYKAVDKYLDRKVKHEETV